MGIFDRFFAKPAETKSATATGIQKYQIAVCALLIEAASSDDSFTKTEYTLLVEMLKTKFHLSDGEIEELSRLAEETLAKSIDTHSISEAVNEAYTEVERMELMENIWELIFSDGQLCGREDYWAHKVSFLLGLTHSQLIDTKIKVKQRLANS